MDLWESLAPRDHSAAARIGGRLTVVAAVITAVFAFVNPPPGGMFSLVSALAVPAGLLVLTFAFRRASDRWPVHLWALFACTGVIGVAGLDIITSDASAAGQVFLCYPVVYGASQLQRAGAVVTAGAAVVADAVVVFTLLPAQTAVTDFCYVTATLVAMTILLVRAGETNDHLISQLRTQAAIDPLTGLVTRRVLGDASESAILGAAQETGTALILLDIDRFKTINDTHGHPVGDAVLIHLAAILVANSRPGSVNSRMGGDELAVLLPGCSSEAALGRARQLQYAIQASPLELSDGTLLAISVSLGVAHIPTNATTALELYQAADAALYRAKREGHGGIELAPPLVVDQQILRRR
jgi:diguanylate cyclase (GGDEF)-like protein